MRTKTLARTETTRRALRQVPPATGESVAEWRVERRRRFLALQSCCREATCSWFQGHSESSTAIIVVIVGSSRLSSVQRALVIHSSAKLHIISERLETTKKSFFIGCITKSTGIICLYCWGNIFSFFLFPRSSSDAGLQELAMLMGRRKMHVPFL